MKTLSFLFLSIFNIFLLLSQTTPQPTVVIGTNDVFFSSKMNAYIFSYSGSSGDLVYTYDLDDGACLKALTAKVNNSYTFWPSCGGGVALFVNNSIHYAWQTNIDYTVLNHSLVDDIVTIDFKMRCNYIPTEEYIDYYFSYKLKIDGRTLILDVQQDSAQNINVAIQFNLDRSDSNPNFYPGIKHHGIGIPYLKLFNILYTGSTSDDNNSNRVFTSFFFDWEETNCSEFNPLNGIYSDNSVYYSQNAVYKKKTDNSRNSLSEILYLTVSPNLDDVFPNIPNPVSNYRSESVSRVIFDYWKASSDLWNTTTPNELNQLSAYGNDNGWMIVHQWQKNGYDCGNPTDVMPSNQYYGGDNALMNIRNIAVDDLGYLFSLHEDYWFIDERVPGFSKSVLQLPITNWRWCHNQPDSTQHPIKNTLYSEFYNDISPEICSTYGTNSGYDDAFTNAPPSFYVDLDHTVVGSGEFKFALQKLREAATDLQTIHGGPIGAEGGSHMFFVGYYDDFEAEIFTGQHYTPGFKLGGYYRPLLVNFDLLKMRDKSYVHGMGYYERFFCDCIDYNCPLPNINQESVLIYTATELAYAHGGFINLRNEFSNLLEQASIQFNHVYPMQSLYADSKINNILYNDNGVYLTVSDYIKKYPFEFDCFASDCDNSNFMGQVRIEYNNGVIVCVNRHPTKTWTITDIPGSGWYNYHTTAGLYTGTFPNMSYTLPAENGWVCYSPNEPLDKRDNLSKENFSPYKFNLSQNYPNPFNPVTEINYEVAKEVGVTITVYNTLGQLVKTLVNNEMKKPGLHKVVFDGKNFASGVYFYKIEAGSFIDRKKMVLIK